MLSCSHFKGRHTGEGIFQEYESIMETFETSSKVKHVITDNTSNMLKAFYLPWYEKETCEEEDDKGDIDSTSVDGTIFEVLPVEHHSCFAHALQLVI